MKKPQLVFGYGNPARGDDALGPLFLERMAPAGPWEVLTDFQLQIEHALDFAARERVLLVDASVSGPAPYGFSRLSPLRDDSYSTHALSPQALLEVFERLDMGPAPPCFVLSIRGYAFDLGRPPSPRAWRNLAASLALAGRLLQRPTALWDRIARGGPAAGVTTAACPPAR